MKTTPRIRHGFVTVQRVGFTNNGNPKWSVVFTDRETRATLVGTTKPNGDGFDDMPQQGLATVEHHETPAGRIVFDSITRAP